MDGSDGDRDVGANAFFDFTTSSGGWHLLRVQVFKRVQGQNQPAFVEFWPLFPMSFQKTWTDIAEVRRQEALRSGIDFECQPGTIRLRLTALEDGDSWMRCSLALRNDDGTRGAAVGEAQIYRLPTRTQVWPAVMVRRV